MQRYDVHESDSLALVVSASPETCTDTTGADGVCLPQFSSRNYIDILRYIYYTACVWRME